MAAVKAEGAKAPENTEEKEETAVKAVRRRTAAKKAAEPAAEPAAEAPAENAEEPAKAAQDGAWGEDDRKVLEEIEAEGEPKDEITEEQAEEARASEPGQAEAVESFSADEVEASEAEEKAMFSEEAEEDVPARAEKAERSPLREEKEKMLTQVAKADTARNGKPFVESRQIVSATRSERKEIYGDSGIIPVGEELAFEPAERKRQKEYLTLVGSKKAGTMLTGTVFSVGEYDGRSCAVIQFGEFFHVLIPSEMMLSQKEERHIEERESAHEKDAARRRFMHQRIGSQVDFIVQAVDEKSCLAVANRHRAMDLKKQAAYLSSERNGRPVLEKGTRAEGRVVVSTHHMMIVEVCGIEFTLRESDISYVNVPDVGKEYPVGSTVPVVFTRLERERTQNGVSIRAKVSVKEAQEDMRRVEFGFVHEGDVMTATVTGVNEYGVIARLGGMKGRLDMLCQFPRTSMVQGSAPELPSNGQNVIVRVRKKEELDRDGSPAYHVYGDIIRMM